MTLTDFLVARIAEDEKEAGPAEWAEPVRDLESWQTFANSPAVGVESTHDGLMIHAHRMLAECEAKRKIVERVSAVGAAMPSKHLADGVLALLALPYADHPDYREEWRP